MGETDAADFLHRPLAPRMSSVPAVYFSQHDVLKDGAIRQKVK